MKTITISSQLMCLLLILIASTLAIVAYLHGNSDATRGVMFTFAGGIVTGAFALMKQDAKPAQDSKCSNGDEPGK